jgi:2-methylcitrate dehydratase PrpD
MKPGTASMTGTAALASFIHELSFAQLPDAVVARTEDLFLDWIASALAGKDSRPVSVLARFAEIMGPATGCSEMLPLRRQSSPYFAALVNAAASHVVEQDDLHNSSVLHPATVVFPAALAAAQQLGSSGEEFITAVVAGYETGVRVGEALGRSHYKVFHTTGTAGTLAAAAAVSKLLKLDRARTLHAIGSAGTQAAGLWEFLRDAADSKQLHTAKAAADGLLSAYIACDGFTGAGCIVEGKQGMMAGMSSDGDASKLVDRLGERWALLETSFKFHASCRHTHPAADALLEITKAIDADQITKVRARVHQAALDVLGPAEAAQNVHQSKFSMGFVLALIAVRKRASIVDFNEEALRDPQLRAFQQKVQMVYDPEIDAAYPARWIGLVEVETRDGRHLTSRVEVPKGDPENTLSRADLEDKAHRLAAYRQGASSEEVDRIVKRVWALPQQASLCGLLAGQ